MSSDGEVDEITGSPIDTEEDKANGSHSEVDELEEADSGSMNGNFSMKATIEDWAKHIPKDKLRIWSTVTPEIKKKKQKKILAREKAKARRKERGAQDGGEKGADNVSPSTRGNSRGKGKGVEGAMDDSESTRKGKGRARGSGSKQAKGKSTGNGDDVNDSNAIPHDSSDIENKSPAAKRARTDASESVPREYTAYILVQHAALPAPGSSRTARFSKANPAPEPTSSEPIFFNDEDAFDDLLEKLATALSCQPGSICLDQTVWVFEKPKNGQRRPLGTETGYQAMLKQLQGRKQGQWVVNIYMPPPKQSISTRNTVEIQSEHDYDDYINDPTGMTIQEQMASKSRTYAPLIQRLQDRYPINNVAGIFPGKRMYSRDGHYWELNNIRLQAWANAWRAKSKGQAGVNIENPPNSMHFDMKQTAKVPATQSSAVARNDTVFGAASLQASDQTLLPSLPLAATSIPLVNHQSFPFAPALAPVLAQAQFMHYIQALATAAFPSSALPGAAPAQLASSSLSIQPSARSNVIPAMSTSTASAAPTQGSSLSIPDFCAIYQIPEDDCARLERLGVTIGDPRISDVPEEHWRAEAFTDYTWGRVVLANKAYMRDLNGSSF